MLLVQKIIVFLLLIFSLLVICFSNVFYSVFSLIFVLVFYSCLLLTLNFEFLGLLYLLVYVGGIMLLFLFVIISFKIKDLFIYKNSILLENKVYFITLIVLFFLFQKKCIYMLTEKFNNFFNFKNFFYFIKPELQDVYLFNIYTYTQTFPYFIILGFILLLVMLGIISILLENSFYVKQKDYKVRKLKHFSIYKNKI